MAINGLTDQGPGFQIIGTLRKGAKKPERGIGKDLEYFRFTTEDQDVAALFEKAYGPKPIRIDIFLPFPTVDENWQAWKEEWAPGGLKHRCDGQTCVLWLTDKGTYSKQPVACPGNCKQVGRLTVVIPDLERIALVTVLTSSINDIIEIDRNLKGLAVLHGSLTNIP